MPCKSARVRSRSAAIDPRDPLLASLGAILWTARGLPALRSGARRRAGRLRVVKEDIAPSVAVVVAAHNEETVIERLVESLLAQDYPRAARGRRRLRRLDRRHGRPRRAARRAGRPRAARPLPARGKGRRRTRRFARGDADVVAFADAGCGLGAGCPPRSSFEPRRPEGRLRRRQGRLSEADGTNREGLYWRYELWLREQEVGRRLDHGRGTGPSTPCAGPTTSRSIRASATTSPSRT